MKSNRALTAWILTGCLAFAGCSHQNSPPASSRTDGPRSVLASGGKSEKDSPKKRFDRSQDSLQALGYASAPYAQDPEFNTERYQHLTEKGFHLPDLDPLSTFSIDVDSASYSNIRRTLMGGRLPAVDAVRTEELVNYFPYNYSPPSGEHPFAADVKVVDCPWAVDHRLVRIGVKGREIELAQRPPLNLVFLLDVSGSMAQPDKLPLVKESLEVLVRQLDGRDRVAIVVYAGAAGTVLEPTSGADQRAILDALGRLEAGGSTNGGQGIERAYDLAQANFDPEGVNRVVLATDGDFNVGVTGDGSLVRLVKNRAQRGVFLTVLGFGTGNLNDAMMEQITGDGNGIYGYVDTLAEARKLLVEQSLGTLVTIAKDVKIQVEFNPERVQAYRLIGYQNRRLADEDFNDDTKDAGDIGAGHTVTAFYEIVPPGVAFDRPVVDPLKYQRPAARSERSGSEELLTVKIRYKQPHADKSALIALPVLDQGHTLSSGDDDLRFAVAVAGFGLLLRESDYTGSFHWEDVLALAGSSRGADPGGYRAELVDLVARAQELALAGS